MTITIIQKLWKENSKKENYFESACGHRAVKGRHQEFCFYYEGACDCVALWNFRLRFEPLGLHPLKK